MIRYRTVKAIITWKGAAYLGWLERHIKICVMLLTKSVCKLETDPATNSVSPLIICMILPKSVSCLECADALLRSSVDSWPTVDCIDRVPLNRPLESREIAEAVLYLSGNASSGITGTTLLVDAGYLAAAEWSNSEL